MGKESTGLAQNEAGEETALVRLELSKASQGRQVGGGSVSSSWTRLIYLSCILAASPSL